MDVRCERCNARYSVDDGLVDEAGLAVRCSKCGHLFRVHRSTGGWRVRNRAGGVYPLHDLALLQRWVVEGRVAREDEVSSDGGAWTKAGDLKDLAPFFAVVEQARGTERAPAAAGSGPVALGDAPAPPRSAHEEPTVGIGIAESPTDAWEAPAGTAAASDEPAWTAGPPTTPVEPGGPGRPSTPPRRRGSPWPWVLLVLVLLGAGMAAIYLVHPDWLPLDALGLRPPVSVTQAPATQATPPAPTPPAAQPQAATPSPEPSASSAAPAPQPPSTGAPATPSAPEPKVAEPGATAAEPKREAPAPSPQPEPGSSTPAPAPQAAAQGAAPPAAPPPEDSKPVEGTRPAPGAIPGMPSAPAAAPRANARPTAAADRRATSPARRASALLSDARRARDRGDAEAALALYNQVLQVDPGSADAMAGRGLSYLDLSRYDQAEESFKAALQADAQHGAAQMGLAETYRYEGRRADAVTYYRKYLAAHPDGDAAAAAQKAVQALEESP